MRAYGPGARNLRVPKLRIEERADVERATARRGRRMENFIATLILAFFTGAMLLNWDTCTR